MYLWRVKNALAIIALLGILAQVLTVPFLAFRLESQRATIALTKCENLDKPQLQCAGSCYISDQLGAAFDQDQSQGPSAEATQVTSLPPFSTPPQLNWQLSQLHEDESVPNFELSLLMPRIFTHLSWDPPRA